MNKNPLLHHIERLRRHYEHAVHTYDYVSLLDLSHSLRIWTELKGTLPSINSKFESSLAFKTGTPSRKTLKTVSKSEYVFCYMPGGTKTFASRGQLISVPNPLKGKSDSFGVKIKILESGIELSQFCYTNMVLEQPEVKALENQRIRRCNYANWLSAEAVRYRFTNKKNEIVKSSISREILIKRVANTMDGSHPSIAAEPEEDIENLFDEHVAFLMKFKWGGLPLPYFVLLQTAQVILDKISQHGPADEKA